MPPSAAMTTIMTTPRTIPTSLRPSHVPRAVKPSIDLSRRRQRVRWGSIATKGQVEYYSEQEWNDTWHSRDELKEYRQGCLLTVEMMENGIDVPEENGLCRRGLESYTIEGRNQREKCRSLAKRAVLKTQRLQSKTSKVCESPDFLSKTYQKACMDAVRLAHAQALVDRQLVEAYYRRTKLHRSVVCATPIVVVLVRKLALQRDLCDGSKKSSSRIPSAPRQQHAKSLKSPIAQKTMRSNPETNLPESLSPGHTAIVPHLAQLSADISGPRSASTWRRNGGRPMKRKRRLLRKLW